MADQGFTAYMSEIAGAIRKNGTAVMDTTTDMEHLIKDVLDYLSDDEKLEGLKANIRSALETLQESLEAGELFNAAALKTQFGQVITQVSDAIDVDLRSPLDVDNIFQTITDNIPDEAFPADLKPIYTKIKDFLGNIELDNFQMRVKTVQGPVERPKSGTSSSADSLFNSVGTATLPSNFDVFDQQSAGTTNAATEDQAVEDVYSALKNISDAFTLVGGGTDLLAGMLNKLETAMIESGFYSELDDRKEAFISAVTGDDLSVEKIFDAVVELLTGLIESAINAVTNILELLIDDLKEIVLVIKDKLLGPGTSPIVEAVFEQFGITRELSILSLPAFLVSLPFTLLAIAVTGEKPVFPDISSRDSDETKKNKAKGAIQLSKILLPFIAQGSYELSRNKAQKKISIGVGLFGDVSALTFDFYDQFSEIPNADEKPGKAFLWGWELSMMAGNLAILIAKLKEDLDDLNAPEITTQSTTHHRTDYKWPIFQIAIEVLTTGIASVVYYTSEEADREDSEAYFWLDALPGVVEGLLSLKYTEIDNKVEVIVDGNEALIKPLIKKFKDLLENSQSLWDSSWEIDDPMYLFYNKILVGNVSATSFDHLKSRLSTLKDIIENIKGYFTANKLSDDLNEKYKADLKLIQHIQETIVKAELYLNTPYDDTENITAVFNRFDKDLQDLKSELGTAKNNLESQDQNRITPAFKESIRQTSEKVTQVLATIKVQKKIPLSNHKKHIPGLTLLLKNNTGDPSIVSKFSKDSIIGLAIDCSSFLDKLLVDPLFNPSTENKKLLTRHNRDLATVMKDFELLIYTKPTPSMTKYLALFPSPNHWKKRFSSGLLEQPEFRLNRIAEILRKIRRDSNNLLQNNSDAELKKQVNVRRGLVGVSIIFNTIARIYCGITDLNKKDK